MDMEKKIKDYWGSRKLYAWDDYHKMHQLRYSIHPYLQEVLNFPSYKNKRILEIGCGSGIDAIEFAKHGAEVYAIDLNPEAVATTIKFMNSAGGILFNVEEMDATRLRFPHFYFDLIYSFGVLHHIPNVDSVISEIISVLKPGGEFIIMLYHKNSLMYYSIMMQGYREGLFDSGWTEEEVFSYYSEYTPGCPYAKAYSIEEALKLFQHTPTKEKAIIYHPVIRGLDREKIRFEGPASLGYHIIIRGHKWDII